MKNISFKKNVFIFIISLSFFFCNDCFCPPWNANTREHLFGNPAAASVEDEGFRWKDSFNFNINEAPFPANLADWKFKKVVNWDGHAFARIDEAADWNDSDPNRIHQHLSQLVNGINQLFPNNASITVAALTIVVDARLDGSPHPVYRAYSKVIEYVDRVLVGINGVVNPNANMLAFVINTGANVFNPLRYLDSNIPSPPAFGFAYNCTEGKILSQLIGNPLLRTEIESLRISAIDKERNLAEPEWLRRHASLSGHHLPPRPIISADKIKLIILHIGTKMDPCAICTRNLVGLSRDMNYRPALLGGINRYNLGVNVDAKFLIEVSSNGHYATSAQNDNYAATNGTCSHTECAGHDNQHGTLANITLDGVFPMQLPAAGQQLAIPYGLGNANNWSFDVSFHPYVIFGRTDANGNVIPAPTYDQQHDPLVSRNNVCGTMVAGPPQRHDAPGSNANGKHQLKSNLAVVN